MRHVARRTTFRARRAVSIAAVLALATPIAATGIVVSAGVAQGAPAPALLAWGTNASGQLGIGDNTGSLNQRTLSQIAQVALPSGVDAVQLSAGYDHALAIGSDGNLYAWGSNAEGQLGVGAVGASALSPTRVTLPGGATPAAVSAGAEFSLAVDINGKAYGWGRNVSGELCLGNTSRQERPVLITGFPSSFTASAASASPLAPGTQRHALFLGTDGTVFSCGSNSDGQLGNQSAGGSSSLPVPVVLPDASVGVASTATAIAAGGRHSLFVLADGGLAAAGANEWGQSGNGASVADVTTPVRLTLPSTAAPVVAVSAGDLHSLALTADGNVLEWGVLSNGYPVTGDPALRVPTAVALPTGTVAARISASGYDLVADATGALYAWGYHPSGNRGLTPLPVTEVQSAQQVAAGGTFTLVVAAPGGSAPSSPTGVSAVGGDRRATVSWNTPDSDGGAPVTSYTVTGLDLTSGASVPDVVVQDSPPSTSTIVTGLTPGHQYTFTVTATNANGTSAPSGRSDIATVDVTTSPSLTGTPPTGTIGVPYTFSFTLDGTPQPTVTVSDGTLPTGLSLSQSGGLSGTPTVPGAYRFTLRATNGIAPDTALGVEIEILDGSTPSASGGLYGWGQNAYGQLGSGTVANLDTPAPAIALPASVTAVSAATGFHTLVVGSDGRVYAAGANQTGQLGNGTFSSRRSNPVVSSLPPGLRATAVAVGPTHSLALTSSGEVYAWGSNYRWGTATDGSLGVGSTQIGVLEPAKVLLPSTFTPISIAATGETSFALGADGSVYVWGKNGFVDVGLGTTDSLSTPTRIAGLPSDVTAIAAGDAYALALTATGDVYSWGLNLVGQLGDGTLTDHYTPAKVSLPAGAVIRRIAAGGRHALAVASDGRAFGWGYDRDGQVGDGTTGDANFNRTTPVLVDLPSGATASDVVAGSFSSFVQTTSGAVYAWGDDAFGISGDGPAVAAAGTRTQVALPAGVEVRAIVAGASTALALANVASAPALAGTAPNGTVGDVYSYAFAVTGTAPVAVTVSAGTLPPGLSLSGAGELAGTPTAAGSYSFTLTAANGRSPDATLAVVLTVLPLQVPPSAPLNVTAVAGDGEATVSWDAPANDGGAPITVYNVVTEDLTDPAAVVSSRAVNGAPLLRSATITGLTPGHQYRFRVTAFNRAGLSPISDPSTPVTVTAPPTLTGIPPTATVGVAYSYSFTTGGFPAPTVTVTSGALPAGLTLSDTGVVSGTPATPGSVSVTLTSSNGRTPAATLPVVFLVNPAVTAGAVYGWGSNFAGQLGSPTNTTRPTVLALPGGVTAAAVAGGSSHTLALGSDGNVYAVGDNTFGQLGDGTTQSRSVVAKVALPPGVTATSIAAAAYSLAAGSDGKVYAWGYGLNGQIGDGGTVNRPSPVAVSLPGGVAAVSVAVAGNTSVAIGADGSAYAWGNNAYGTVGDDTAVYVRPTPVRMLLPAGVRARATAGEASAAFILGSDGNIYASGLNSGGELGDGTTTNRSTPVRVALPTGVTASAIAGGGGHGLAVGSDGVVYAWGQNLIGQLGDGTRTNRSTPVPVALTLPAGVVPVDVGGAATGSAARTSDGSVYGWGFGQDGEFGNGGTTSSTTPVKADPQPSVAFSAIAVGSFHVLAIGPVPPPPVLPSAPLNVTAVAGDREAMVSWDAPASDGGAPITVYNVLTEDLTDTAAVVSSRVVNGVPLLRTTTITGLTPGHQYRFRITALTSVGLSPISDPSNTVTATDPPTLTGVPPTAIVGAAYSYSFTTGGFPAPTVTVTGGTLPAGLTLSSAGVLSGTATTSGTYTFTLTAANGRAPDATLQGTVSVTSLLVPPAPTGLTGVVGPGVVRLSWQVSAGATDYLVQRGAPGVTGGFITLGQVTGTSFDDTNLGALTVGATVSYRVVALANQVASAPTPTISVTLDRALLVPATPTGLTAVVGLGVVRLSWQASPGATDYVVQRAAPGVPGGFSTLGQVTGTTFDHTNLGAFPVGSNVTYRVVALANQIASGPTPTITVTLDRALLVPATPTGLTAVVGLGVVRLSWQASPGATSYLVQRAAPGVPGGFSTLGQVTGTTFDHTNLSAFPVGSTVTYRVVALANQIASAPTPTISVTLDRALLVPATPTGLTAVVGLGVVRLSWQASPGATDYVVQRAAPGVPGGFSTLGQVTGTAFDDTNLGALPVGSTVTYRVVALANQVASAPTPTITVTLNRALLVPATPTGLTGVVGPGVVRLTWQASPGATSYLVQRAAPAAPGGFATLGQVTGTAFDHTNLGAFPVGATVTYRVVALANQVASAPTPTIAVTLTGALLVPATPTGLTGVVGPGVVRLTWQASPGATGYLVQRRLPGAARFTTLGPVTGTGYDDTNLGAVPPGATVTYRVVAFANQIASAATPTVTVTLDRALLVPATPTGLTGVVGPGVVRLSWQPSPGATEYLVQLGAAGVTGGFVTVGRVTGTAFDDTNLGGVALGSLRTYRVVALANQVASAPTPMITVRLA